MSNIDYMEIIKYIATFIAGLGSGVAITIRTNKFKSSHKSNQNRNFVGGDMAGRDINK